MRSIVDDLKKALGGRTVEVEGDLFELLSAACKACCSEYTGGNESCPPPKIQMA